MAFTCPCYLENGCASGLQMAFVGCFPAGYRSSYLKEENHLGGKQKFLKIVTLIAFIYLKYEGWKKLQPSWVKRRKLHI